MSKKNMTGAIATVGAVAVIGVLAIGIGGIAGADGGSARVTMRDASGNRLGTVSFVDKHDVTEVRIDLRLDATKVATNAFHGIHIHANSDAGNGVGCVADATKETASWFVSADGHWKADGQDHGSHHGDLSSVFVTSDGTVSARFTTGRIDRAQLPGKAVILHAAPDNFGNVPIGVSANQYTAKCSRRDDTHEEHR